ncbi:MAG: L-2-amino-thiazoline-4-carboxylic acid hydrolase [Anaerolineales bacterium]|nr:L-2-amino-thiazoline-4-carboxylic acid hydrolase [Anaerolineales bacterium]
MTIEDTFRGAKNGYIYYFAYLTMVAEEIGMGRAIALENKMCEARGAIDGNLIKEQAGVEEFDAKAVAFLAENYVESIGISSEVIAESPQKVRFKIGRCPLYEAAQAVGLEDEIIETLCRAGPVRNMDSIVKQLNPNLNYQLRKFRSSEENFCEEMIELV